MRVHTSSGGIEVTQTAAGDVDASSSSGTCGCAASTAACAPRPRAADCTSKARWRASGGCPPRLATSPSTSPGPRAWKWTRIPTPGRSTSISPSRSPERSASARSEARRAAAARCSTSARRPAGSHPIARPAQILSFALVGGCRSKDQGFSQRSNHASAIHRLRG